MGGTGVGVWTSDGVSVGADGEYKARNAYSTAKDRMKAKMTRFSITNFLSHGIESPAVQRMTSKQPAGGPDNTSNETEFFYGVAGIFGTRRREPARGWQPRRDNKLIHAQQF